jgi:hypothetical protein
MKSFQDRAIDLIHELAIAHNLDLVGQRIINPHQGKSEGIQRYRLSLQIPGTCIETIGMYLEFVWDDPTKEGEVDMNLSINRWLSEGVENLPQKWSDLRSDDDWIRFSSVGLIRHGNDPNFMGIIQLLKETLIALREKIVATQNSHAVTAN